MFGNFDINVFTRFGEGPLLPILTYQGLLLLLECTNLPTRVFTLTNLLRKTL